MLHAEFEGERMIPDWMKEVEAGPCPHAAASSGGKSFIQKTLDGIFSFLQEAFVSESFSRRDGLMQSLDPRAKLVFVLMLVFALSLTRDIEILIAFYIFELLICHYSRIEVIFFIKRVWLFVPLFTGVIALPMIFNIFLPGDPLVTVARLGPGAHLGPIMLPESIYITRQGVLAAATFTLRVAASVSAVVLLFLTTRQQVIFKSLRSVGVPRLYVLTLEMAYRYIFLLTDMMREIHIARRARTIRPGSLLDEQRWVGSRIGYILMRSLGTSEKVHMAMISRGFNGEVRIMQDFRLSGRDYMAGFASAMICLLLVLVSLNLIGI
jgi:cobalt/nickel transport system permease protein